jgi:hypothetical protein
MSVLLRILFLAFALACLAAICPQLSAKQDSSAAPPAGARTSESILTEEAQEGPERPVPVTPGLADKPAKRPLVPEIQEGTTVLDLPAAPRKENGGKWLAIRDAQGRSLRLLPSSLLEEVERVLQDKPGTKLRLSGETYVYDQHCFLMLRKADIVPPVVPAQASQVASRPADTKRTPAAAASGPAATSRAAKGGLAAQVALTLLQEDPGERVLPFAPSSAATPPTHSLVPTGKPSKRQLVESRVVRLAPAEQNGWPMLVFESDNTLQEPPLRVLPNSKLQQLERLNGPAGGKQFYVSGEICRYHDMDYLLLRWVKPKRYMSEF